MNELKSEMGCTSSSPEDKIQSAKDHDDATDVYGLSESSLNKNNVLNEREKLDDDPTIFLDDVKSSQHNIVISTEEIQDEHNMTSEITDDDRVGSANKLNDSVNLSENQQVHIVEIVNYDIEKIIDDKNVIIETPTKTNMADDDDVKIDDFNYDLLEESSHINDTEVETEITKDIEECSLDSESVQSSEDSYGKPTRWEALADLVAELPASMTVDPITGQIYVCAHK